MRNGESSNTSSRDIDDYDYQYGENARSSPKTSAKFRPAKESSPSTGNTDISRSKSTDNYGSLRRTEKKIKYAPSVTNAPKVYLNDTADDYEDGNSANDKLADDMSPIVLSSTSKNPSPS